MVKVFLENVTQNRGQKTAVNDVNLELGDGEILALLGPTGGGKTTLLRLIAGLDKVDTGRIFIADKDVSRAPPSLRNVALIPRLNACQPHFTLYETLAYPLRLPARKLGEAEIRSRVEAIANKLKIHPLLPIKVGALDAGDRLRASLGRAFIRNASLYLFDNPLAFLGSQLQSELSAELTSLLAESQATAIFATQDQSEAMMIGHRIAIIEHGRIIQTGPPREIYEKPANIHIATQIGSPPLCLLPIGALPVGAFPSIEAPRAAITVGTRPEHLAITKSVGRRKHHGVVERVEPLGGHQLLHIALVDGPTITTLKPQDEDLKADDRVSIAVKDPLWFDAAGNRIAATG